MNLKDDCLTVGLSATAMMGKEPLKVESAIGPIVFNVSLRELIDQRFLVDAEVFVHSVSEVDSEFMDYHDVYNEAIINNIERNGEIIKIADESENVLVLVDRIEHGEQLLNDLQFLGQDVVFLHGKSKDKFDIDHDIIIATSIFDLGVDIPRLKTLILAGGGKSTIKTVQRMGRVLRLFDGKGKAVIHDFADSSKWVSKHFEERKVIFEENFNVIYK
jgi:superfamily II DNA or RNA helicase